MGLFREFPELEDRLARIEAKLDELLETRREDEESRERMRGLHHKPWHEQLRDGDAVITE